MVDTVHYFVDGKDVFKNAKVAGWDTMGIWVTGFFEWRLFSSSSSLSCKFCSCD
jgi:hypothetical protein